MTDLAPIWAAAVSHRNRLPDPLPAPFGNAHFMVRQLVGALPVRDVRGGWEPLPIEDASRGEWRLIIAVRTGNRGLGRPSPAVLAKMPEAERDAATTLYRCTIPAAMGDDIADLIAYHPKRPNRLPLFLGRADALSDPDGDMRQYHRVRIARDLAEWVRLFPTEPVALPLGTPVEQAAYLRGCKSIIAADVSHGEVLEKMMRRPIPPLPPVFVATPALRVAA